MEGDVWPGKCVFPDFTDPKVREWWSGLFKDLTAMGVRGVWNDMNEPAVFELGTFPEDVRHDYDGENVSHRKAHNVYGHLMSKATATGLKKHLMPNRPFVITRSAYAGTQRWSSVWTGDNIASWEHLWLASVQCQRLGLSGLSFAGSDIGGFIGEPDVNCTPAGYSWAPSNPLMRTPLRQQRNRLQPGALELRPRIRSSGKIVYPAPLPAATLPLHHLLAICRLRHAHAAPPRFCGAAGRKYA